MKKEVIITAILFSAVLGGTIFYFTKYAASNVDISIYNGLPGETLLAVNTYNSGEIDKYLHKNILISSLCEDTFFNELKNEFASIETLIGADDAANNEGELIWVLARVNSQQMGLLLLVNDIPYKDLNKWVRAKGGDISAKENEIGLIKIGDESLSCYSIGNVLAISAHTILLEGSRENLLANNSMADMAAIHNTEASVWLNFDVLHWLLPKVSDEVGSKLFSLTSGYKGVGLYKVSLNETEFNFYGNVNSTSLNSAFNPMLYGKPSALTSLHILPEETSFFLTKVSWSAENNFRSALLDTVFKAKADSIGKALKLDILNNFCPYLDEEFSFGLLKAYNHHLENASFLANKVKDLENLQKAIAGLDTTNWQIEVDSLLIKRIPNGAFLPCVYGEVANTFLAPYYAYIDGFIVLANKMEIIQNIWQAQKKGKTLANSLNYGEVADWINTQCNLVMYVNPSRAYNIPRDILSGEMAGFYERNLNTIKNLDHLVFQLVKTGDYFYNHIYGKIGQSNIPKSNILFTRNFEDDIIGGPFLVTNYHTKTKEIMVVDAMGTVHQINRANELVWSYKMNEPSVGRPYEIDLFKNGKLQYVLASKKHLHLIDRTGSSVSGYPITLAAGFSGSSALFDFENIKEYNIYVPCKGKRMYAYNAKGQPLNAWNPIILEANPKGELQYFNKGGINYCFISDQKGNLYIWNEAGKRAVEPIKTGMGFSSNFTLQFGTQLGDCKLLGVDSTGNFVVAGLNGTVKKTAIGTAFSAPKAYWWQVNGDGSKELIVWQNNILAVYDQSLKMQLKITIIDQIERVEVLNLAKDKDAFAIQTKQGKVFLYSIQGELLNLEPFDGSGAHVAIYDLDEDGKVELITTKGNELIIYKNIY